MLDAGEGMDKAFAQTSMTFDQAWIKIKNTATKAFEPVLQQMNDLLNSPVGQAIVSGIGTAIQVVATAVGWLFNLISIVFTFVYDNWGVISKILLSIAAIIAIALLPQLMAWVRWLAFVVMYYSYVGVQAVISALKVAAAWAIANWPLLLMLVILAALVLALIWVADSFADAAGIIVGVVFAAGAIIWNIVVGVVNAIVQFLWTNFVEPWIGIIEWVLNVFNGGFNSFGDAVKNLLGNIISWFLSLGKVVTKIIDAIFGTNWTGGLESLQDKVLQWGKNEQAITLNRDAPEVMKRIGVGDAYANGYDVGFSLATKVGDKLGGLAPKLPTTDDLDYKLAANTADIADNTGSMADSMAIAEEDLEYLKDVAHMEWKKEYTTASINIDMTNNNTINETSDWEGWFNRLGEVLNEELSAQAQGVYSY